MHTDDGFIFPAEDKDPEDKPKKRRKRMKELPREDSTDDGKVTTKKIKKFLKKLKNRGKFYLENIGKNAGVQN